MFHQSDFLSPLQFCCNMTGLLSLLKQNTLTSSDIHSQDTDNMRYYYYYYYYLQYLSVHEVMHSAWCFRNRFYFLLLYFSHLKWSDPPEWLKPQKNMTYRSLHALSYTTLYGFLHFLFLKCQDQVLTQPRYLRHVTVGVSILQYKAPGGTIVVIWYNINKIEVRLRDHLEYSHWSNLLYVSMNIYCGYCGLMYTLCQCIDQNEALLIQLYLHTDSISYRKDCCFFRKNDQNISWMFCEYKHTKPLFTAETFLGSN